MCRFVAYLGFEILLETVLVKPINSIIMQSLHARESDVPTNGDGFGLGWYVPEIDNHPAIFRSILPAWGDTNLLNLTAKIKSPCFFAHVRAASVGGTNTNNCHPFSYKEWMLMHNGQVFNFLAIKRALRRMLDDEFYNAIQGDTDSEHLFALFLQLLNESNANSIIDTANVLLETLAIIIKLVKDTGEEGPSLFNICLTNGEYLITTRYSSDPTIIPESLHYLEVRQVENDDPKQKDCVLIASERLTEVSTFEWKDVPANHILLVDANKKVTALPM